jgi:hypothetical protein
MTQSRCEGIGTTQKGSSLCTLKPSPSLSSQDSLAGLPGSGGWHVPAASHTQVAEPHSRCCLTALHCCYCCCYCCQKPAAPLLPQQPSLLPLLSQSPCPALLNQPGMLQANRLPAPTPAAAAAVLRLGAGAGARLARELGSLRASAQATAATAPAHVITVRRQAGGCAQQAGRQDIQCPR